MNIKKIQAHVLVLIAMILVAGSNIVLLVNHSKELL